MEMGHAVLITYLVYDVDTNTLVEAARDIGSFV